MTKVERPTISQAAIDAEKAVLGALLRSESTFWTVHEKLRAFHFTQSLHQQMFTAIYEICFDQHQLSLSLVLAKLPDNDNTFGLVKSYVYALVENAVLQELSPLDFVDEMIERWGQRQGAKVAKKAYEAFAKGERPVIDILAELQSAAADIGASSEHSADTDIGKLVDRFVSLSGSARSDESAVPGFDTGLPDLDEMLGRLRPGRLYFLGGDQKSGKTALAMQILRRACDMVPGLMAQTEMTEMEIAGRELGSRARLSASKMESGEFTSFEFDQMREARDAIKKHSKLRVWQCGDIKISQLKHRCLAVKKTFGLGFLMVDHLLNVHPDKEYENIFFGITKVIRGLKNLALEMQVPVLCMTHRTRDAQSRPDPTPYATDFFGGGEIERSADALFAIYSRHRWLSLRKPENRGEEAVAAWQKELLAAEGKVQVALLAHRHAPWPKIKHFGWNGPATILEHLSEK